MAFTLSLPASHHTKFSFVYGGMSFLWLSHQMTTVSETLHNTPYLVVLWLGNSPHVLVSFLL